MRYVALLRGINVGGKNLIGMPALKACFEDTGFDEVSTYIQSGNVLFETSRAKRGLADAIEAKLEKAFELPLVVVVRSHAQLKAVVSDRPKGFGRDPAKYRYDVAFLKEPLTAAAGMKGVTTKEGVDVVTAGKGVIYMSRLAERAAQSRLNKVASLPQYKSMTIRNWNTTTKLLALLDARASAR
jgi:uncharacterized protein (DUF1697 family)